MSKTALFAASLFMMALSQVAEARTKSFSLTAQDMHGSGADLDTYGRFWNFGDNPSGTVSLIFALPNDYKKNTKAIVRLSLFEVANCEFDLRAVNIGRFRGGRNWESTAGPGSGFQNTGPVIIQAPNSPWKVITTDFELKPATNIAFNTHKPGDVITLNFNRFGGTLTDTCNFLTLSVVKARVIYTVR